MISSMHGIFTDGSVFSAPFLLWKKGISGPVTQWCQFLVIGQDTPTGAPFQGNSI